MAHPVRLNITKINFVDSHLIAFVSGGVPPYKYSLTYGDTNVTDKISTDGWIDEPLINSPKPGTDETPLTTS